MFKNKLKKICVGVISLVLLLAFGLWGCSDSGSSKKEKETETEIEIETFPCFEYGDDENSNHRLQRQEIVTETHVLKM